MRQFAHIARPLVSQQSIDQPRTEPLRRIEPLVERRHKVRGEPFDVVAALAQRRQRGRDRVQPVIQVFTEQTLAHHRREIAVGGAQHPHVHRHLSRRADPSKCRRIQHPQQLHLRRQTDFANLVEKDRAAVRHLEQTRFCAVSARERAAFVPEELALKERLLQGGAFDHDERLSPPCAPRVYEFGDHLLAGAGLARDQHVRVGRRDPRDQIHHAPEFRTLADDGVAKIGRRESALEQTGALLQRLPLQRAIEPHLKFVERTGLGEIVEGAELDGLDRGVNRAVPGEHDDVGGRLSFTAGRQHRQAAHVRQLQIEQDDVGRDVAERGDRIGAGRGRDDPKVAAL